MDIFSSFRALFLTSVTLKRVIIKNELQDFEYIHVLREIVCEQSKGKEDPNPAYCSTC